MEQNKLLLQGVGFDSLTDSSKILDSNPDSKHNPSEKPKFGSLQTSMSQGLLQNYKNFNKSGNTKRTFREFYNQQMAHVENKTYKLERKYAEQERSFQDLRQRQNKLQYLCQGSKRILSNSKERAKKTHLSKNSKISRNQDLSQPSKLTKPSVNHTSSESVYERLFNLNGSTQNIEVKVTKPNGSGSRKSSSKRKGTKTKNMRNSGNLGNKKLKSHKSLQDLPVVGKNVKLLGKGYQKKDKRKGSKSRNGQIASTVSNKLFSQGAKKKISKLKNSKSSKIFTKLSKSEKINQKSCKLLKQRFLEDFEMVSKMKKLRKGKVTFEDQQASDQFSTQKLLTYAEMLSFCQDLGFLTEGVDNNEEKVLFIDLWACLQGDLNDGVSEINLKILLAAIQGFKIEVPEEAQEINKYLVPKAQRSEEGKFSSKPTSESQIEFETQRQGMHYLSTSRDTTKFICFEVGKFINGILHLKDGDIKKCQKYFIILSRNRSQLLNERNKEKQMQRKRVESERFRPRINGRSEELVRGVLDSLNVNKIPHYELLLYKGKEYKESKEKLIREKKKAEIEYSKLLSNKPKRTKYVPTKQETIIDYLEELPLEDSSILLKHSIDLSHEAEVKSNKSPSRKSPRRLSPNRKSPKIRKSPKSRNPENLGNTNLTNKNSSPQRGPSPSPEK